ncbi:unnamed protein product [Rotaria sp. Silwood2]|nr:unnamed protein product [Rotaria sp. Silwood2]CAF2906781.1 unnamed protein product [Rotaria sp. Silwood2]CAF3177094.1 unnamed protein product [Rotaria sp. Silwood2]CAF3221182.1 unnamed protein product [Rotaria sp. Silwood2]CAF3883175.1 unnamed protein product [Rotaria sp. Silwood2]
MQKSTKSSLTGQDESSSLSNTLPINDQKDISAKNFIHSCSYRIENIDRNAIIKRQDMEACLKRLSTRDDVHGVIVTTIDGRILYECDTLKSWTPVLASLCLFARHLVRNIDPGDNIQALRLRTKNYELLITIHNEQLLIVMQMLSISNNKDININNIIEEDWDVFLKRIQQKKIENEE